MAGRVLLPGNRSRVPLRRGVFRIVSGLHRVCPRHGFIVDHFRRMFRGVRTRHRDLTALGNRFVSNGCVHMRHAVNSAHVSVGVTRTHVRGGVIGLLRPLTALT